MICHNMYQGGSVMATIKSIFNFLRRLIISSLKIAGAVLISASKIMLVFTLAVFKIVFSIIRITEYN